jgi:hypothetical protein
MPSNPVRQGAGVVEQGMTLPVRVSGGLIALLAVALVRLLGGSAPSMYRA